MRRSGGRNEAWDETPPGQPACNAGGGIQRFAAFRIAPSLSLFPFSFSLLFLVFPPPPFPHRNGTAPLLVTRRSATVATRAFRTNRASTPQAAAVEREGGDGYGMEYSTQSLCNSIRAVLAERGIRHARVIVDLLPGNERADVDGTDGGRRGGKRDAPSTDVSVIVNGWEQVLLVEGEPAQQPMEPQKILPPPRAHSPSGNVTPATVPLVGGGDAEETREHDHHRQPAQQQQREEEDLTAGELDFTARPTDAQRRGSPVAAPSAPLHAGPPPQVAASSGAPAEKRISEEAPHGPATKSPTSGGGRPSFGRQANSLSSDGRRDAKGQPVLPAVPPASAFRKTSVVLVEQQRAVTPPKRTTPSGPTPVFSILNTEHGEQLDRTSSNSSSRKISSVMLVESPAVEELKHQPHHAEAGEDVRTSSILVNATPKQECVDSKSDGAGGGAEVRFPPVGEQSGHASQNSNSNVSGGGGGGRMTKPAAPQVEAWKLNSKQRLQEMLQEQREMEQDSMIGRAKHEEILGEAEKFLQDVEQRARAAKHEGRDSPSLPFLRLRTGPAYSNYAGAHGTSPRCQSPSASSAASTSGIRVVKFTMPSGGKAKEEVISQLSTSQGGSQHLSSKDKYSMLLREQDKLLRQKEEGEGDYKKLVEQAVAYHEQQRALKRMQQEQECENGTGGSA
ncbi:uncharacterized protein Tco025E_04091 [Trypanosoma conorhini]|uniref:Uncharacterized protein n=1 Tax=Trypanosoma conorhini TaxID=83891 RepID=A0A3R7LAK0_9TRYP|nr:uncharacterized protein Tco025E_04091 [Trypanosoma conorhini]RNF19557.1 hypothetical protein Tco025E_04091 [Trypanosoma conorhini]